MFDWLTPETLQSKWFEVLAAFVAINTLIYATLTLSAILPRLYPTTWFSGNDTRSQTRSIYPDSEI